MPKLPHNLEAERATLGSILVDPKTAYLAIPFVDTVSFYDDRHRLIYGAILKLQELDMPADTVTVSSKLKEMGCLEEIGGQDYLISLIKSTPSSVHVEHYASIVRDYAKLRDIVLASTKIINTAERAGPSEVGVILDDFSDSLYTALSSKDSNHFNTAKDLMMDFWDEFEIRYNNPGLSEVSSGFIEVDSLTYGYNAGDLVIVAGRPSMGKTSYIMSSMLSLGSSGVPHVLFPYEMSKEQSGQRLVSMSSKVDLTKIRTALNLNDAEIERITKSTGLIAEYPLYIDNNSFGDLYYLTAAIRRYVQQYKIRVVFIDYLQIIPTHSEDLTNEYGRITRTLKVLANSLGITIVLCSQLNRSSETRAGNKPRMSDLRQSGRIEEDADIVILLWRDKDEAPEDAEINVSKNRNGPIGLVNLFFDEEYTQFSGRGG